MKRVFLRTCKNGEVVKTVGQVFWTLTESMHYRNLLGSAGYDEENKVWYGEVELIFTPDMFGGEVSPWFGDIKYEAPTEKELRITFEKVVDDYLEKLHQKAIQIAKADIEEIIDRSGYSYTKDDEYKKLEDLIDRYKRLLLLINEGEMSLCGRWIPPRLLERAGVTTGIGNRRQNKLKINL